MNKSDKTYLKYLLQSQLEPPESPISIPKSEITYENCPVCNERINSKYFTYHIITTHKGGNSKMELETSTKTESTDFKRAHISEGIYVAELKEVKDISEGQYGARVAFVYNIIDQNVDIALVCYKSKATQDNKIGKTLIAHGAPIDGSKILTESLPQKKVRAWVEDFKVHDLDGKETGETASIISKVKPLEETV